MMPNPCSSRAGGTRRQHWQSQWHPAQRDAFEAVLEAAKTTDAEWGTNILDYFWHNINQKNFAWFQ
jgi:hypothetical protein